MPTFAAIDIGSNSCRLKIAKVVAHKLQTLHEDREVTRLGASVFETGMVSPEAMTATLEALKRFQRAVVLLRLAVALNQNRASDVLRVAVKVYPKRVYLEVEPGRTGAELELWSLRKEADYFREVFGRELFCTLA
jgi:hypothetical protein